MLDDLKLVQRRGVCIYWRHMHHVRCFDQPSCHLHPLPTRYSCPYLFAGGSGRAGKLRLAGQGGISYSQAHVAAVCILLLLPGGRCERVLDLPCACARACVRVRACARARVRVRARDEVGSNLLYVVGSSLVQLHVWRLSHLPPPPQHKSLVQFHV